MKRISDAITEKKPDHRGKKAVLPVMGIAALLIVSLILGRLSSSLVTDRIIDFSVQNLEELAMHDEQAIESKLRSKWITLERIGEFLKESKCSSTNELLSCLGTSRQLLDCSRLVLVADDGNTLSSNRVIARDDELLDLCTESEEHFIYRVDDLNAEADGRGEELFAGVKISPFTVEGVTYSYLVARLEIDTLESELKLDSYNGRGYGSVIDLDGNYIVTRNRSYTAQKIGNFYSELSGGRLEEGYTPDKIRLRMSNREHFSLTFTREDGTVCIMAFIPMEGRDWYFIMTVPRAVFEEQSHNLMQVFWFLMGIILLSVAVIAAVVFRRRSRMLAMEKKHREELSETLALAEQASRAKTTFLNNMSHDIRTPMNAIIGFTALASVHIDNKERVSEYLAKISQSSNHLLSLINDVLDMSRIESGKVHIEEKEENLAEILHGIRNIVQVDIHAKQLELFIDTVDVTDEDIYCDKLRLNQILLNILSNAMKYTAPGGTISVRVTEKAVTRLGYGVYEFRVRDNGIGMSPEFKKTVFEPFTREHSSTVSGIQGTGLGMSITKNIVDMMGGTIELESEKGKGTEFIVTLEFKLQEEHKEVRIIERLEGLRGLVVDDDMNTCQSVSQMLRQIGMRPEWTMYGREAVARTEEAIQIGDRFQVYIIDWLMPDMNGIETTRRIRALAGKDAPIILLSAYDWADIEAEAREAGATDFISKPLFPSELHRILLKACGELTNEETEEPEQEVEFAGKRLLLVEDNELNREIAAEILQDAGFVVETANDGREAVDAVRASEPGYFSAVLMDIQMPVMDGYEATGVIRRLEDPGLAHIPIIAMTANAFEEDKQMAYDAGMDAHVGKPVDISILLKTLKQVIRDSEE